MKTTAITFLSFERPSTLVSDRLAIVVWGTERKVPGLNTMNANRERPRRRIWEKHDTELQARQTQASKDALKRQHKAKKSRIVKRHVLFKQKKSLLKHLKEGDLPKPIIAKELGRPGEQSDDEPQPTRAADSSPRMMKHGEHLNVGDTKSSGDIDRVENPLLTRGAAIDGKLNRIDEQHIGTEFRTTNEIRTEHDLVGEADGKELNIPRTVAGNQRSPLKGDSNGLRGCQRGPENRGLKGGYVPFAKQIREYEALKKQRENEEILRQENIKKREEMLQASKKSRRQRVRTIFISRLSIVTVYILYIQPASQPRAWRNC